MKLRFGVWQATDEHLVMTKVWMHEEWSGRKILCGPIKDITQYIPALRKERNTNEKH